MKYLGQFNWESGLFICLILLAIKYFISSSQKLNELVVHEITLFVVNEMRFRKVNLFLVLELENEKTRVRIQKYHYSLTSDFLLHLFSLYCIDSEIWHNDMGYD